MSDDLPELTECTKIEHPNIMPGWGCCGCRTYNDVRRVKCKACGHTSCYTEIEVEDRTDD